MSEPIQSISQGNYILQGTVATSAGIVGDGSTQNPLRADETVLYEGTYSPVPNSIQLNEPLSSFESIKVLWSHQAGTCMKWAEYNNTNAYWFENIGRINTDNGQLYSITACWRPTSNLLSANYVRGYYAAATTAKAWSINNADINEVIPVKVVGINRISG